MNEYKKKRELIENEFRTSELKVDSREEHLSPSGNYQLIIEDFKRNGNYWDYSRGTIKNIKLDKTIAVIKRNYSHFWYAWCEHINGEEYLLCGEDYQGQTVVNLTQESVINHFPQSAVSGNGFCWTAAYPSPDTKKLAVEGCYWACPYEVVFYDFTNPFSLPYKEIARVDNLADIEGWVNNDVFKFSREIEVRSSDGEPYRELSDDEQEKIDNGLVKSEDRIQYREINISKLQQE